MKSRPLFLVLLLSFALFIQNTCPFGAAGKTAVSALGRDCPLKHSIFFSHDLRKNLVPDLSTAHFPDYLFEVPEALDSFQVAPFTLECLVQARDYRDALPEELLRPPRPLVFAEFRVSEQC